VNPHRKFCGYGFGPFGPTPPIFGPTMIKDMNQLLFLWVISEEPEGMTGYNLQKAFHMQKPDQPNTTVYRTLKQLENEEYLASDEQIVNGRTQKIYKINKSGMERLQALRQEMQNKISFFVPPEGFNIPFQYGPFRSIEQDDEMFKSKEKVLTILTSIEDMLTHVKERLQNRLHYVDVYLGKVHDIAYEVKESEVIDPQEIKKKLREIKTK
jgi:DNA-binding PadR family transcriptional regulator